MPPLPQMAELDGSPVLDLAVSEVIHKTFEQVSACTFVREGRAGCPQGGC